jgi:hypothetical protein
MAYNPAQPRIQALGLPTSGQWAATAHAEPALSLGATFSQDILEQVANRHYADGAPYIDMTPERLNDVRAHLDSTGDFSHAGVRKAAEDSYAAEHGYTVDEHHRFIVRHGDTSAWSGDPAALRRDIEQMRKDTLAAAGLA